MDNFHYVGTMTNPNLLCSYFFLCTAAPKYKDNRVLDGLLFVVSFQASFLLLFLPSMKPWQNLRQDGCQ